MDDRAVDSGPGGVELSRRSFLSSGLALGGAALLAGCGSGGSSGGGSGGGGGGGGGKTSGLKIVVVPKWTTYPYFQRSAAGARKAAKELGNTVTYTGPTSPNAEQQVATLQTVVAQKPDVILLAAIEPDNVAPVLKRARSQGITVVTYDADCAADARDLYCNQLTYEKAGQTYLDAALKDDPKGGKCVFMAATPTTANHIGQIDAMKKLMSAGGKYGVFQPGKTYYVEDDVSKSVNTMTNIMQSDPSVKFMLSGSAVSVPAACQAINAAGNQGKVFSTGAALPGDIKKYLMDGSEKAFVLWDPANLGYMAAYAGALIHAGKLKPAPGAKFKAGTLGTFTVEADNIAPYNRPLTFTKKNIGEFSW